MVVITIARWGDKPFSILNLTSFPRFDHGLPSSSQRNGGSGQLGKSGPVQEPACGSILQSCPVFGQWSKESANPHHVDGWTSDWICLGVRTFGGVWRHGVYVKLRPTSKIKDFLNGTNTCIESLEHAGGYNVNPPSLWSLKMVLATLSLPRFKLWMVIIFDILILVAMSGVVNLKENWVLWSNFYFSWISRRFHGKYVKHDPYKHLCNRQWQIGIIFQDRVSLEQYSWTFYQPSMLKCLFFCPKPPLSNALVVLVLLVTI